MLNEFYILEQLTLIFPNQFSHFPEIYTTFPVLSKFFEKLTYSRLEYNRKQNFNCISIKGSVSLKKCHLFIPRELIRQDRYKNRLIINIYICIWYTYKIIFYECQVRSGIKFVRLVLMRFIHGRKSKNSLAQNKRTSVVFLRTRASVSEKFFTLN